MPEIPQPRVMATRYEVSCLPENDRNARNFTIMVEYWAHGKWVIRHGFCCLSRAGEWNIQQPSPGDTWLADHLYDDLDEALQVAREHAPKLTFGEWAERAIRAAERARIVAALRAHGDRRGLWARDLYESEQEIYHYVAAQIERGDLDEVATGWPLEVAQVINGTTGGGSQ